MGKVQTGTQSYILLLLSFLLMLYCDYTGVYIGGLALCFKAHMLFGMFEGDGAVLPYVFAAGLGYAGQAKFLPALLYHILGYNQGLITGNYGKFFHLVYSRLESLVVTLMLPHHSPYFGANSEYYGVDWLSERLSELRGDFKLTYDVEAVFVRAPGVSQHILEWSQKPLLETAKVIQRAVQLIASMKLTVTVVVGGVSFLAFGPLGLLAAVWVHFTTVAVGEGDIHQVLTENKGVPVRNGVYYVEIQLFGMAIGHGIGTAANNILHIPYHVCYANKLMINGCAMRPYYIDTSQDLVTYGGPPQFARIQEGEEIFVNCESKESRTTYSVEYTLDRGTGSFAWASLSKPGESGSPIYVERDGEYHLVGLAGRYIMERDQTKTEFVVAPEQKREETSLYSRIITHPGSGKTRKAIPAKLSEYADYKAAGKRVLVTGPTRVVCLEIYNALRNNWDVGLNIKDHTTLRRSTARIQIMAHATALKLLNCHDRLLHNLGAIIIDEAHFEDPATKMLRDMAKSKLARGVYVCEMSATLDGEYDAKSNFDIVDTKLDWKFMPDKIADLLGRGQRVLVFVPSLLSTEAKLLTDRFVEFGPVALSRNTFESAIRGVNDVTRRLILCTDIAECGINIPDLDAVFDTGVKFKYVFDAGVLRGDRVPITRSSYVQRRGRVGREKPGHYYYADEPKESVITDAATMDYEIAMTGRAWSSIRTNALGLHLTEKQFEKWLDSDLPITEIWLTTDVNAMKRSPDEMRKVLRQWMEGNVEYITRCTCAKCVKLRGTKFQWYDERLEGLLHRL